ncbi:MAG: hypothetical protein NTV22_15540 [bacterium]|nr:hypothetical protein [bacterium]
MKKLFTFMIMAVALGALSASAAYFAGERFNYPMGDLVTSSGGTWHYWQGNPPAPVVTNLYPYGSSSTNVTLDGAGQEGLWFFSNVFNSSTQAIVGFSFAAVSSTNENYYVYFCSGNAALQDSAYNESGLGGFVINYSTPATYTNIVSLHFWNSFGFYELSTTLSAAVPGNTPPWHDVRAVMYKTITTGGYARLYIDGIYLGNVPFAMRDVNSLVTNALNTVDMYQTGAVDPDNRSRLLVDNIFLEDRANYTRYVAPTGNDASDGLTPATAYQTIAQATWQIPSGGNYNKSLIYVAPGTYANEYTIKSVTNNWKYGLYIRAGQVDRPNCYDVAVIGSGANNTIMYQDFSTVPGMTLLEQTMGFYIRDLRGWIIQDLQVQVTSNMPQDAWSWYYGTVGTYMGCRDSSFVRCLATMPLDWAKGKPGFHLNGGSGLTLQGCASVGGGMGFNVAGGPLAPLTIANNTFVGMTKGTSEGNSGVAMVFNGGSGTVTRCIVADAQRGGVLGGLGDVVHSVENDYYNCGTNSTPGTNYYDSGNILPNGDSYQQPAFATQDGFPYRAGLGNIGYKAARGGVYYIDQKSPVAQDGGAFGSSWATAYRSVSFPVSQLNQATALSDATYPVTFYLRGFFTNQFTASNGNPVVGRGLQYAGDYVSFIGESPTNTMIYKSSAFRNETGADGRNLTIYPVSKVSCTVRNMTLMTENWFPPSVNAYSLGAYRNWDTKSYLSNVYVHVLHCGRTTKRKSRRPSAPRARRAWKPRTASLTAATTASAPTTAP